MAPVGSTVNVHVPYSLLATVGTSTIVLINYSLINDIVVPLKTRVSAAAANFCSGHEHVHKSYHARPILSQIRFVFEIKYILWRTFLFRRISILFVVAFAFKGRLNWLFLFLEFHNEDQINLEFQ